MSKLMSTATTRTQSSQAKTGKITVSAEETPKEKGFRGWKP
jgi:hypothetical protein